MALTVVFALPDSLILWVQGIVEALPELLGTIQAQLLDLLSLVLAGRPYRESIHPSHLTAYHAAVTHGECRYATLLLSRGNQYINTASSSLASAEALHLPLQKSVPP